MKKYFRKMPTDELVLKAVRSLGFDSLNDIKWVEESFLNGEQMLDVLLEIRQYYIPCHAKVYLDKDDFNYSDYICIVRQLLRCKGSTFERRERSQKMGKNTFKYVAQYRMKNKPHPLPEAFEVEFE